MNEATAHMMGSSPRMRGKLPVLRHELAGGGLIPAYAGKTSLDDTRTPVHRAHPRVCGENACQQRAQEMQMGSSPRMRGKPLYQFLRRARLGLIPAYAGKTPPHDARGLRGWAHPRVCGENRGQVLAQRGDEGSSPRMRGKLEIIRLLSKRSRLIPAYAGKTVDFAHLSGARGAHPRVCGENLVVWLVPKIAVGSSPRMRGKLLAHEKRPLPPRLIPAYAGKTSRGLLLDRVDPAHPRVCGENSTREWVMCGTLGSSPRMRGKPVWILR